MQVRSDRAGRRIAGGNRTLLHGTVHQKREQGMLPFLTDGMFAQEYSPLFRTFAMF